MADSPVLNLHNSLRQAKERWAFFLGAGASYDYGIPTMYEIAEILRGLVWDNKPEHGITAPTLKLLKTLCPNTEKTTAKWNIEELLTRLSQLLDATKDVHKTFAKVKTTVGDSEIPEMTIKQASDELIGFMAKMCDLSSHINSNHGTGKVDYLADFILAISSFGKPSNKLIRMFTTNIDLCVEAALVRLSQRPRAEKRPDFVFVDGFESSILPTFNIECYRERETASLGDRCAIYYWKLHGSIDWTYSQAIRDSKLTEIESEFSDQSIIVRRVESELSDSLEKCGALSSKELNRNKRIVIFPTPAKYSQTYTFPYMDIFETFRRTLEGIELLICIGTSFPDQHICSAIRSFVERDNTLLFVVDPQLKTDDLRTLFGVSSSIQPVISMGFRQFVQEFKELDAIIGTTKAMESVK